tara:strand:- start:637 stop:1008 length:372 start_codon:yes stop_codon:yes gene_type:complete
MNYVIQEDNKNKINDVINYNDIIDLVNNLDVSKNNYENENYDDNWFALIYQYEADYTKKELDKIADYYNISKRKKRKMELCEEIVIFEMSTENEDIVNHRKLMWFYFEEIKKDNYLKKFIILD